MQILIIGATGFIGRALIKELDKAGHEIIAVSRKADQAGIILGSGIKISEWDGLTAAVLAAHLSGVDAVVNLAGENIAGKRWTSGRKKILTDSRVVTGKKISEAIALAESKPRVIIQGSATGIYGNRVDEPADENRPDGTGFLADLTRTWEAAIDSNSFPATRVVFIRTGLVLGENGGIMAKMMMPFRFYAGSVLGSGRQWMSWIHISDQVRAIRFLLEHDSCHGSYNLTAPEPVQMKTFIRELGKQTGRPAWIRIPSLVLKAFLGEMAEETVLASQRIIPSKLLQAGFTFRFPTIQDAFTDLLTNKNPDED
jgi:uncharacterized protein (TIGR01777 family)